MAPNTYDELFRSEKEHMERVYNVFDNMLAEANAKVAKEKKNVDSGAYEDHSTHIVYHPLTAAKNDCKNIKALIDSLSRKPYYAHIVLLDSNNDTHHYYLSDYENLEKSITVDGNDRLIPFRRKYQTPISEALHKC